ncbi:hypothetical protein VTH06DRAFT_8597 [Thermothelomyces fergusii]
MDKHRPEKGTAMKKRKDAPAPSRDGPRQQQDGRSTASTTAAATTTTTARAAKRAKIHDARAIRTQPSDAALEDGKLDLQRFLDAREFEMRALEESMRRCRAANASRVFQQVPRAMRRRTASHNAKRVPKRLRERARREMAEDNTPTVEARRRRPRTTRARIRAETARKLARLAERKRKKMREKAAAEGAEGADAAGRGPAAVDTRAPRPKIRRNALNEPPRPDSRFRKRQANKTWLPTHLWHAKRAKMTDPARPLWRFAIPLTPTEKCYRPTHRAAGQRGVVAWDVSYMSTIGLYGAPEGVERVLRALGLTQEGLWGARGRRWRAGVRAWTGMLSRQTGGEEEGGPRPRRDIGPATIVWNPEAPARPQRQLFIRTHPACFLELFRELCKLVKMQTPQLYVEDLRFEIGSIELIGPGSTEALLGILRPLTFVARGVATTCARIYRLPSSSPSSRAATVGRPSALPRDLRDQWLRKLPQPRRPADRGRGRRGGGGRCRSRSPSPSRSSPAGPPRRMPAGVDMETRKRLLARSLLETELPYPPPRPAPDNNNNNSNNDDDDEKEEEEEEEADVGGGHHYHHNHHHPLCPDEADLLGFVTTGAFSLGEGRGSAIASISAARALEAVREGGGEGRLCVVRNAGENVGWLARWELV